MLLHVYDYNDRINKSLETDRGSRTCSLTFPSLNIYREVQIVPFTTTKNLSNKCKVSYGRKRRSNEDLMTLIRVTTSKRNYYEYFNSYFKI